MLTRNGRRWPIIEVIGVLIGAIVVAIVVLDVGNWTEGLLPRPAKAPARYRFRVGDKLDQSFVELAKRLVGAGALHAPELRALRRHALDRHDTVDDYERIFMAALMVPENAAVLASTPAGQSESATFPLATISPNMRMVIDLDPAGV